MKYVNSISPNPNSTRAFGTGIRSLMTAVCVTVAATACDHMPHRPARDFQMNQHGEVLETYEYYLPSEARCVRDTVLNGVIIRRQGKSCQAVGRRSWY